MIDFHCHLDLYPNPKEVVRRCDAAGLYVLSVTTTPSAFEGTLALASGCSRIRTGLGLHPQLARERRGELALFSELLDRTSYVGEIGLDGSPECKAFWADQTEVFEAALKATTHAGGRVLSLHSRRAASAVLDACESYPKAGPAVLHWFSGTARELSRAIDLGCWFSVGPTMLAGSKGRSLAAAIPRDRILTETDGPFASINGEAANPWDADLAVPTLSELWEMPADGVRHQLGQNLRKLVALV